MVLGGLNRLSRPNIPKSKKKFRAEISKVDIGPKFKINLFQGSLQVYLAIKNFGQKQPFSCFYFRYPIVKKVNFSPRFAESGGSRALEGLYMWINFDIRPPEPDFFDSFGMSHRFYNAKLTLHSRKNRDLRVFYGPRRLDQTIKTNYKTLGSLFRGFGV